MIITFLDRAGPLTTQAASNSGALSEELLSAFRPGVSLVIADMSATEFLDSSAIRHLIMANHQASCTGAELRVVIQSPAVLRVLQILEADRVLRLYPELAAALTGAPQTQQQTDAADVGTQVSQLPAADRA